MRYPITNTGLKSDVEKDWYVAQGFGGQTAYGYHEGLDWNLKTGGDTDLGQELKAIANGRIIYYHYSSHPNTGFGRHLILKIDGDWGTRWIHYAHCLDTDFTQEVKDVNEGQIIARLGKTGAPYAHLHFAIFKINPASFGIDNIANNLTELHNVWEDPIMFIDKWMQPTQPQTLIGDQIKYNFGPPWGEIELQRARSLLRDLNDDLSDKNSRLETIKQIVA